ncbi:ECF transporter S component [Vagococcus carniphilus]|uniref:ECF transporter S component n=1 Tax=Vagococcus carniphilus TaxID=218144 RepID=A0AAW8U5J5_9ENTE|nr:ECF transporter S component [Vagococcus carniphilus]MDT2833415.1 ECF transporter S component [Vagococcus carniphilus]
MSKIKKYISWSLLVVFSLIIMYYFYQNNRYNLLSLYVVIISFVPFFNSFERKEMATRELVLIAVMSATAVVSKIIFFFAPSVNPLVAIVIISGIQFGPLFGFMVGAISPFVANMMFTQGPWTPFQMLTTGLIGLIAGSKWVRKSENNRIVMSLLAVFSGVLYSLLMDIWTVLSIDGVFTWTRYLTVLVPAVPFTITYMISNTVFVNILIKPLSTKIKRVKQKYGLEN